MNSSEQRKHIDAVLKEELGSTYIGVQGFYEAYFGSIEDLEPSGVTLFQRCQEGDNPLFDEDGWRDWSASAKEREVLDWLSSWLKSLRDMATGEGFGLRSQRTVLLNLIERWRDPPLTASWILVSFAIHMKQIRNLIGRTFWS